KTVQLYPEQGGLLFRVIDQGPWRATVWFLRNYPNAGIALLLLSLQLLFYYALALAGLRLLPKSIRLLLLWVVLYFALVSGGPAGLARYRVPIMPLVCISAGIAIASKSKKTHAEKSEPTTASSARVLKPGIPARD